MAEKTPVPGLVLAGRYRLEEKLGEGGMGTVWKAEHLVLCAPVAVKVLDRDVSRDEEAHDRFIREARAAATLRSPHVVQILDYGIDEGYPYIAMELLEGETLQKRLAHLGKLSPIDTARVIGHIARAVGRAHDAGIIHRDLKPENVFIVKNEDAEICKVLDFGVAKVEKTQLGPKGTRTRTGSLLGTPFYMSPEQAQGNQNIDHRSDLWALAVMAFECITGKRPFESDGLGELVLQICVRPLPVPSEHGQVPPRFDEWWLKATQRDPDRRFQTARELSESLRESVGSDSRETLATFLDDRPSSSPKSVVVGSLRSSDAAAGTAKTLSTTPKITEMDDAVHAESGASAHKPSFTVRQFGTTHATSEKPKSRTALVLGVGILALVIGVGAGLLVLGGTELFTGTILSRLTGGNSGSGGGTAAANTGSPANSTGGPAALSDAGAASVEADAGQREEVGEKADASLRGADGAAVALNPKDDKKKKDAGKTSGGFDSGRDWGKTDEPPSKPEDKPAPPAPAPAGS